MSYVPGGRDIVVLVADLSSLSIKIWAPSGSDFKTNKPVGLIVFSRKLRRYPRAYIKAAVPNVKTTINVEIVSKIRSLVMLEIKKSIQIDNTYYSKLKGKCQ